ncbi:hypothetical protein COCSUDRAFT_34262 [Coccomyxa subellipsoidea C-169]|uniref:Uncharacterized protein n=1 Tax=Coccomyxa subellipsoidea (strain C-169) TaxID=574566 RepID=I0YLM9_COCSC|nr:hypothetical protein COCSUDRAFT_34262 [Coccomyxa subellipsoidea C-169]EIE19298.1 hypothetical protein COCSUDRAFT_34262 [Coccomyxa subellipsoidea C-169]|eukprot:XP_005643842.1 hypothetical protein COCSUDRAFT_34262 [Coccomyxa subellipsoidea C-169]
MGWVIYDYCAVRCVTQRERSALKRAGGIMDAGLSWPIQSVCRTLPTVYGDGAASCSAERSATMARGQCPF